MTNTREKITYCLANVAAVLAALAIVFWLDLDRPYWAMFTVFIVSKPVSGAVRAKGVYRFIGTLVGASMSVFLVPPLVQSPALLSLAASLWIGFCLYFALQDRTPRSYAFLLAGYSVAIVGLSTVNEPTTIFDVATSRLEEITIGIICASLAHSIFFPRYLGDVLRAKAEDAIRLTAQVARGAMGSNPVLPSTAEIATLAITTTDLGTIYSQIDYETSNVSRQPWVMAALLGRLAEALSRASMVCRSLQALNVDGQVPDWIRSKLNEISAALSAMAQGEMPTSDLIAASAQFIPNEDESRCGEATALHVLALRHAATLATLLAESHALAAALTAPDPRIRPTEPDLEALDPLLYRDRPLAFLSATSACAATLVASVLWIKTSWPEGFVAAQFAAIGCSLFATLDAPSKPVFEAVLGIAVALPVAALYEFAILPGLDGFPSLALALAPVLLLFSYLQTFERLEGAGMVLAIAFSGGLALQESFASDFASFANSNLAEVVGLLIAAGMLLVFRTIDPVWNARRLLNSSWALVRGLARTGASGAWLLPVFDRTGQAAIRLTARRPGVQGPDVLLGLRIGLNVVELRRCGAILNGTARTEINDALRQLTNLAARPGVGSSALRRKLSRSFVHLSAILGHLPKSVERTDGLAAVMGLRLDLDASFGGGEASL